MDDLDRCLLVGCIAGGLVCGSLAYFVGGATGSRYGYSDGCHDGSRGHSQVVEVEGKRRCVPHPEALKMRGK